jgi:hypothetical protein
MTVTPVSGSVLTSYLDTDGDVYAMALDGTTLYIGGNFTLVGATARNGIAAINAQTGSLLSWNPGVTGGAFKLKKIIPYNGQVYVFGDFTVAGGAARNGVAAIDAVTGLATAWDPDTNNIVNDAAIDTVNAVAYIGGAFTLVNGGTVRNRLAAIDLSSGLATGWDPNIGNSVTALGFLYPNVYFGGTFTTVNGATPRNRAAAVDSNTGIATTWDPNFDSSIFSMVVTAPTIWLAGSFTTAGGFPRSNIAAVNTFDAGVQPFNPGTTGVVNNISFYAPQTLYMAGALNLVAGSPRMKFAAVDTVFSTATSWIANSAGGANVGQVVLRTPWAVFVGGQFTSINAVAKTGIAATVP